MSEHLYRDEVGAAVERMHQLQEENARLHAELERLSARRPPATGSPRAFATFVVAVSLGLAMLGSLVATRSNCPHRSGRRTHAVAPQRTYKTVADPRTRRVLGPEFTELRGADDCSIPYAYDSNGVRHYKASCLGFADPGSKF